LLHQVSGDSVQRARVAGHGGHHAARPRRRAVRRAVHARGRRLGAGAREVGALEEHVPARRPVPLLPPAERRPAVVDVLGHVRVPAGREQVALAQDRGVLAPADGVDRPPGRVVVVHHVERPEPAPRQPLDQPGSELVVRHRRAHAAVERVLGAGAEQHHLVVVLEQAVGHRHARRPARGVQQPVRGRRQVAVVHPHVVRPPDVDAVAVRAPAPDHLRRRRAQHARPRRLDVVDVQPVHDHVVGALDGDLRRPRDVHLGAARVDGLERRHPQLALQLDGHAPGEDDPQRPGARHAVAQRPRLRALQAVAVAGDGVDGPVLAADGAAAEADGAVGERLAVAAPVGVAAPAVVDGVPRAAPAHGLGQHRQRLVHARGVRQARGRQAQPTATTMMHHTVTKSSVNIPMRHAHIPINAV
jgi:hypothetical protein